MTLHPPPSLTNVIPGPVRVPSRGSGPSAGPREHGRVRACPFVNSRTSAAVAAGRGRARPLTTRCRARPLGGHQRSTRLGPGAPVEYGNSDGWIPDTRALVAFFLGNIVPRKPSRVARRPNAGTNDTTPRPSDTENPALIREDGNPHRPLGNTTPRRTHDPGKVLPTPPRNSSTPRKTLVRTMTGRDDPVVNPFRDQGHQSRPDRFPPLGSGGDQPDRRLHRGALR